MKKILMATDLSARSDRALERAVRLARSHSADLTIVHVIDGHLPVSLADEQAIAAKETIRAHLQSMSEHEGSGISIAVVFGRAHVEILALGEKVDADLIVVGAHREDSFMDLFRGTTVERVIRAANVPVLFVRERISKPYQRIMVGVDFSVYSKRAVEFARLLVPQGVFHLVHAYDVPFRGFLYGRDGQNEARKRDQIGFEKTVERKMTAFLADLEVRAPKFERVLQEGSPQEVLHYQIGRVKPDLLVIGTHGLTGVAHAFLGSVAEDMLRNPLCDVLAVKA